MHATVSIALVGDYNTSSIAHQSIPLSIELAAKALNIKATFSWVPSEAVSSTNLLSYQAIWCTPGSPYKSMEGALQAIKAAREHKIPFLGTCGGFQHAIIEYARDVLLLSDSDHLESNPETSFPLITPLVCSLLGTKGSIFLEPKSKTEQIYQQNQITETFNCSFGVNPKYQYLLEKDSSLHITGIDTEKNIRVIELNDHPFFIATLYQPERSALTGSCHPLIKAFIEAAIPLNNSY